MAFKSGCSNKYLAKSISSSSIWLELAPTVPFKSVAYVDSSFSEYNVGALPDDNKDTIFAGVALDAVILISFPVYSIGLALGNVLVNDVYEIYPFRV